MFTVLWSRVWWRCLKWEGTWSGPFLGAWLPLAPSRGLGSGHLPTLLTSSIPPYSWAMCFVQIKLSALLLLTNLACDKSLQGQI